jgi:hypothetical protein
MVRTQFYLTEEQDRALKDLAARSGRKRGDLIREAVERLLSEPRSPAGDWREALGSVRGMCANRDDLDDLYRELRGEVEDRLDRQVKRS